MSGKESAKKDWAALVESHKEQSASQWVDGYLKDWRARWAEYSKSGKNPGMVEYYETLITLAESFKSSSLVTDNKWWAIGGLAGAGAIVLAWNVL